MKKSKKQRWIQSYDIYRNKNNSKQLQKLNELAAKENIKNTPPQITEKRVELVKTLPKLELLKKIGDDAPTVHEHIPAYYSYLAKYRETAEKNKKININMNSEPYTNSAFNALYKGVKKNKVSSDSKIRKKYKDVKNVTDFILDQQVDYAHTKKESKNLSASLTRFKNKSISEFKKSIESLDPVSDADEIQRLKIKLKEYKDIGYISSKGIRLGNNAKYTNLEADFWAAVAKFYAETKSAKRVGQVFFGSPE